jgi:hypothetical protein
MHKVVAPPEVMAMAALTAERRPGRIAGHKPSTDPQADLVGALAEHVWAWLYKLPQTSVYADGQLGDGGIDFWMEEGSVDIKASRRHGSSWVVKTGPLRADWYVFSYVVLPDTVFYLAKAPRTVISPIGESQIPGKRLVRRDHPGVTDFEADDFTPTQTAHPRHSPEGGGQSLC